MSLGENIQKYRKGLDLSQEELGQKLLVSRQTISLWEKDQTVPTIDNLMRLKEVFGVSVDEILGFETEIQSEEKKPKEAYKFGPSKEDLKEVYRSQKKIAYKFIVLTLLLSITIILFCIITSAPDIIKGVSIGVFFAFAVALAAWMRLYNRNWKKSIDKASKTTYEYLIYEDHFMLRTYRNNEKIDQSKCYFSDIEQLRQLGKWLSFQIGGKLFILRKNDLQENSAFFSFMYNHPNKTIDNTHFNKWRTISAALVAVLWLLLLAVGFVIIVLMKNHIIFPNDLWLCYLPLPVPIASIVFGFLLKSKGYDGRLNIGMGIIITIGLIILGSLSFLY